LISTGGLTASISEQSLTSLVFCLRCLRVATTHLGTSISTLQSLLSRAQAPSDPEHQSERTVIGRRIEKIKQDIVDTLRKAVDVISRHAGSALPEPARRRVKVYILSFPSRWAAASTPSQSPPNENGVASGITREEETGWKVLTLANESLEMLSGVMTVVGDTLQSAEEWAGRLGRNKRSGTTAPTSEPVRDEQFRADEKYPAEKEQEMQVDC
jgi:hypothetical protein